MKVKQAVVTPSYAQELLRKNTNNRKLRLSTVNFYAKQMEQGLWREDTSETIKVSTDGRLLDGQHRLAAVIKYGRSMNFLIAEDLDDAVFTVLDTGKKRNGGDTLTILGVEYAALKAAGIAGWFGLKKGLNIREMGGNGGRTAGLTNQAILEEYNRRPQFWDQITAESHQNYYAFNKTVTGSFLVSWRARLDEIDAEKAKEFMEKLSNGLNFKNQYDPTYQLRNILLAAKLSSTRKLDNKYKNALIIKAWNAFYNNSEQRVLSYNPKNEKYPTLVESPAILV